MVFWFFQLDASSKKFETRTPTQNSALEKLKFVFSFFNMCSLFFSHCFGNCFNYRIYNELFQEDILMASSVFSKYKMLILVSNFSKINNMNCGLNQYDYPHVVLNRSSFFSRSFLCWWFVSLCYSRIVGPCLPKCVRIESG